MHLLKTRYQQEQQRVTLALQMVRLAARTQTIRACTGLSNDHIRRLYKHYLCTAPQCDIYRHRGKAPRSCGYFLRNTNTHLAASLWCSLLIRHDLLSKTKNAYWRTQPLLFGLQFCIAYDHYQQLPLIEALSFDHAWFLRRALTMDTELQLLACPQCTGLILKDRLSLSTPTCPMCWLLEGQQRKIRADLS